ncbi:MAG TPA: type 4a pilus biogenesis protein PilO [Candidatus Moranbacteria bacterium]|nr:type 4a pilus biogenesis protein PilO [Candidatus Moranbacteria bacterium]
MKLKILLPPLLIVGIIIVAIWMVYPAYTNGADGFKEKRAELKAEEEKLTNVENKIENVKKLSAQLSSITDKKEEIVSYIPETIKEEQIIDNVNFIAGEEGLSVKNISVVQPKAKAVDTEMTDEELEASGLEVPAIKKPEATLFDVEVSMVGNYDKIKNFLDKVHRFHRFKRFDTIEIKKYASEKEGDTVSGLQLDAVLSFNFYKKSNKPADMEDPVFANGNFSGLQIVDDIKNKKNISMLKMEAEQAGRVDPFSP